MTTGIDKFKLDEKIHIYYLKHRGNIVAVSNDLPDIDLEYIKKIVKKIKNRAKRDIDYFVANNIMEYFLLGTEQRKFHLQQILNSLEHEVEKYVTMCCKSTFETVVGDEVAYYTCDKCHQTCKIGKKIQFGIVDKINATVEKLLEEDKALVVAAEKLGYTKLEPDQVTKVTQHNIILTGNKDKNQDIIDVELIRQAEELSGTDREQVRKSLTRKIIDSKDVTKDGQPK